MSFERIAESFTQGLIRTARPSAATPPQTQRSTRTRLGLLDPGNPAVVEDLIFDLNPSKVTRARVPRYAMIPGALADYGPLVAGMLAPSGAPFAWVGDAPEEVRIDFLLAAFAPNADVETQLLKLDQFMAKDTRTGEPPNLIFSMGQRSDVVRIFDKSVEEKLYTPDLRVQQATVHLVMRALNPRRRANF